MSPEGMVHALEEIWRVLTDDGYLIDLRPHTKERPVQVVADEVVYHAGMIDGSARFPLALAATDAMQHMVDHNWFMLEQNDAFELFTYWPTSDAIRDYFAEREAVLPPETLAKAVELLATHGDSARLRTRQYMLIARYRKNMTPDV